MLRHIHTIHGAGDHDLADKDFDSDLNTMMAWILMRRLYIRRKILGAK